MTNRDSRCRIGPCANGHGGDEHIVRTRPRVGTDNGAVLVHSVVVSGNRPGTDVGTLTNLGITDVAEVGHFGPRTNAGVLGFDKRTDLAVLSYRGSGA